MRSQAAKAEGSLAFQTQDMANSQRSLQDLQRLLCLQNYDDIHVECRDTSCTPLRLQGRAQCFFALSSQSSSKSRPAYMAAAMLFAWGVCWRFEAARGIDVSLANCRPATAA